MSLSLLVWSKHWYSLLVQQKRRQSNFGRILYKQILTSEDFKWMVCLYKIEASNNLINLSQDFIIHLSIVAIGCK